MGLTNAFKDAVTSGDVLTVRIMMKDSLLIDPSFELFKEMEKATSGLAGLYEVHDGRDFQGQGTWDDNYMNKLMVQVVNNFSKQRVEHLKQVINHLRPDANRIAKLGCPNPNPQMVTSMYENEQDQNQKEKNNLKVNKDHSSSFSCKFQKKVSNYEKQKAYDQKEGNYRVSKVVICTVGGATIGGVGAGIAVWTIVAGGAVTSGVIGGVVVGGVIGGAVAGGVVGTIVNSSNRIKKD